MEWDKGLGTCYCLFAVRLLGDMPTFIGYEPNNLVGKGPGNAPIALGPSPTTQTTGSASSSSAARQQVVPADTLEDDFVRLFEEEMSSLFDDPLAPISNILDEPLVPLSDNFIVESGPKGLAVPLGTRRKSPSGTTIDAPKDDGHHGASSLKQAKISDSSKPKDDGHHGKPAKQARFSQQIVSIEPDDLSSMPKGIAPISDTATDDFQSTSQSSCLSMPKGIAQALSPDSSIAASTEAIVSADRMANLEAEIALLRRALEAKDVELYETKVHAQDYASKALRDSRGKAEQALAFQKCSFEEAHAEYSLHLRDICDREVAQSTEELEALANSVIGQQQQELHSASVLVSNLQQHLDYAQSQVAKEAKGSLLIETKAKAQADAQKASSDKQLSTLRVALENDARASHSKIMNAREKEIKSEAEALHTASMQQEQQMINSLQSQLQQSALDNQKLEGDLVTSTSNYSISEGNLAQVQTELRKTQESLVSSDGLLAQSRQNRELLETNHHVQLNPNHNLQAEIAVLRSNVEQLTLSLTKSQSEQLTLHQQEVDSIKQTAEGTIKVLQEQLRAQADLPKAADALAKAELDRLRKVFNTESAEMLDSQAAKLKAEHEEVLAERDFAFNNAQATIATQNDEIEELQNVIQEQIDKNFTLQQAAKGRENFRIDANDSVGPATEPKPQQAASSTSPTFYPLVSSTGKLESMPKGIAVPLGTLAQAGGTVSKDSESMPKGIAVPLGTLAHAATDNANSYGFTDRASYEEAVRLNTEHARKQAVSEQIVPFAGQIAQDANGSQYGGNIPNFSAIPAPPNTFAFGKKVSERISIGGWPSMKSFVAWKLAFLKAVAAASITPDQAFI